MFYDKNNIFAKIIRNELPCNKVYEDDHLIAFHDIYPVAPVHILVLPKRDCINYADFVSSSEPAIIAHFFNKVNQIAMANTSEFRLVTNCGASAGQTVMHFHIHILGGKQFTNL